MMSDARQPEENLFFLFFERCLVATKFVWLSFFTLIESLCNLALLTHHLFYLWDSSSTRDNKNRGWVFFSRAITQQMQSWTNKKLLSQFSFKTSQSGLEVFLFSWVILMKNLQQRQTVAKLGSGNHDLRIETGWHSVQKFLKTLGYVNIVHLMYVKNENSRQHLLLRSDILLKTVVGCPFINLWLSFTD